MRGVVLNSRDITDRVRLEQELTRQAQRDNFGSQLVEALEMADEESATYDVVDRAMVEISEHTPMELLLSDSSRAHLDQTRPEPRCRRAVVPVESPYSCVAVRRGNPVVFESSESAERVPEAARPAEQARARPSASRSASWAGRSAFSMRPGPDGVPPMPSRWRS